MLCLQVWSQCLREVLLIVYACFCWLLELMLIYTRLEAYNLSGAKVAFYVANCFVQLWSHYLRVLRMFPLNS